ncbi:Yip1 family protein [Anaerosporobacter sp.]
MANFCGKCGKPLQDGETCSCSLGSELDQTIASEISEAQDIKGIKEEANKQAIQSEQQVVTSGYTYGQPMQGQPMQGQPSQFNQQASQAAAVAGKYAKNIWKVLLDIWKAPADNLKNFVNEKNFVNALILIGAEAILSIIFSCLLVRKIYSLFMSAFYGLSYFMEPDSLDINYFSTVLSSLIGTILGACIFAAITMLIVKEYGKANKTFKEGLCVAATKSAALLPFLVVAIIMSLFSLTLAILAFAIGSILGYYYVHTALDDGTIKDENKRVYTTFLIFGIYVIVTFILMYLYMKLQ